MAVPDVIFVPESGMNMNREKETYERFRNKSISSCLRSLPRDFREDFPCFHFKHLGLPGAITSTKQFIDGTLLPGRDSSDEKDLTASVTATATLA